MEGKKQMKTSQIPILVFLVVAIIITGLLSAGCSNQVSSIQKDLDDNPKLKEQGITVKVTEFNNGYVMLTAKGLSRNEAEALRQRKTAEGFSFIVPGLFALAEAEEILKKRPDVKGVMWTAE